MKTIKTFTPQPPTSPSGPTVLTPATGAPDNFSPPTPGSIPPATEALGRPASKP
jgi:hypothetical protein